VRREGFALDQVLRIARPDEAYLGNPCGRELDLLIVTPRTGESPPDTPAARFSNSDETGTRVPRKTHAPL
jgi:hypothetical protein